MLRSRQMLEVLWFFEFVRILTDAVTGLSHRCGRPLASEKEILKGHKMTFNLVRIGWPNTAAILALAAIPFMTLATVAERQPATGAAAQQPGPSGDAVRVSAEFEHLRWFDLPDVCLSAR